MAENIVSCLCCGTELKNVYSLRRHYASTWKEGICHNMIWLTKPYYKICPNPSNNKKCKIFMKRTKHGLCKSCSGQKTYNNPYIGLNFEERYGIDLAKLKRKQISERMKLWHQSHPGIFTGSRNGMFGKTHTEEVREHLSANAKRQRQSLKESMSEAEYKKYTTHLRRNLYTDEAKMRRIESRNLFYQLVKSNVAFTKPELKFCKILDELNVRYCNQYTFKYYIADFYLPDYDLYIEVDGDYWHANPNFYKNLDLIQKNNKHNDNNKNSFFRNQNKILLRFWEYDINHNREMVLNEIIKILEYICLTNSVGI